jgi:hypothetical protein
VPSALAARSVSTGTQLPFCSTRTGLTVEVRVSVPLGLAVTWLVSVVAAATVTGRPVTAASTRAAASAAGAPLAARSAAAARAETSESVAVVAALVSMAVGAVRPRVGWARVTAIAPGVRVAGVRVAGVRVAGVRMAGVSAAAVGTARARAATRAVTATATRRGRP